MNQKLINAWKVNADTNGKMKMLVVNEYVNGKVNADTNGKMKMLVVNEYVNVKIQCRH